MTVIFEVWSCVCAQLPYTLYTYICTYTTYIARLFSVTSFSSFISHSNSGGVQLYLHYIYIYIYIYIDVHIYASIYLYTWGMELCMYECTQYMARRWSMTGFFSSLTRSNGKWYAVIPVLYIHTICMYINIFIYVSICFCELWSYVWYHACICIFICIYVRTYLIYYIWLCIFMCIYVHTYLIYYGIMCVYVYAYVHMYIRIWYFIYVCVFSYVYMYIRIWYIIYVRVYIYKNIMSMRVIWLIHMCDMTQSHVWHDSFIHVLFTCVTWLLHTRFATHSYWWCGSRICVTWLIHICDMIHSYVRRGSCIFVTWLISSVKD